MNKPITIMYSGGGTLGPVTPLLAIHEIITKNFGEKIRPIWIGTKRGVEQELVAGYSIPYLSIQAGKLRRYISIWNIIDLFKMGLGFFQALFILLKENPTLCISAGGFVSVPVHYAAWVLGIPTWIHQQDVQIGLANKLMSPIAKKITCVIKEQVNLFPPLKTTWLGNPVRGDVLSGEKAAALSFFKLNPELPVVLATGGGTGSLRINQLIIESVQHLRGACQVIHLSGKERPQEMVTHAEKLYGNYYQVHQFLGMEMRLAYAVADLVICRGGFGTLSELGALKKPAIVIPKPGHQVENVDFLEQRGAVILLDENKADGNLLAKTVKELLADKTKMNRLAEKLQTVLPPASAEKIIEIVKGLTK